MMMTHLTESAVITITAIASSGAILVANIASEVPGSWLIGPAAALVFMLIALRWLAIRNEDDRSLLHKVLEDYNRHASLSNKLIEQNNALLERIDNHLDKIEKQTR